MTTDTNLVILPGPTLREGLDNLGQPLASVTPIRDGKHRSDFRPDGISKEPSEAECPGPHDHPTAADDPWTYVCAACWPLSYAKNYARHLPEVTA